MEEQIVEKEEPQIHIGKRLKEYRIVENLRPADLARTLDVTRQHYAILEKNADMKFTLLINICSKLGLPLSYFLIDSGFEHLTADSDEQVIQYRTKLLKLERGLKELLDSYGAS